MPTVIVNPDLDGSVEYPSVTAPSAPSGGVKIYSNSGDSDKPYAKTSGATYNLTIDNSLIETGTAAPTSTPGRVGMIFVDTSTPNVYVAKGTASSADWLIVS
jgi:hypothetical protein